MAKWFEEWGEKKGNLYLPTVLAEEFDKALQVGDVAARNKFETKYARAMGSLFSVYANLYTSAFAYGASEKSRATPTLALLRETARNSAIDRLIIETYKQLTRQVSDLITVDQHQKGWAVRHVRHRDPYFQADKDVERRCREMEELINSPNREVHPGGFRDVVNWLVEEMLVIDRGVIIKEGLNYKKQPLPEMWHGIPGDTLKPRLQVVLRHMANDGYGAGGGVTQDDAVQMIFQRFGVDVSHAAYIQDIDNRIYGAWDKDACAVMITNPSSEINRFGYGVSGLEASLQFTTFLMMALHYNEQMFLSNYPEAFLLLKGAEIDQAGLEAFKQQIYGEVGPQGNARLPVIPAAGSDMGAELLKLRETMTDMEFVNTLRIMIALKCSSYGASPELINFMPFDGAGQVIQQGATAQDTKIAYEKDRGYKNILDSLAHFFTREFIRPYYDDLVMEHSVRDEPTESERIELATKELAVATTVDEYRLSRGLKPLSEVTDGKVSGDFINNPFFLQWAQAGQAQKQQETRDDASNFTGKGKANGKGAGGGDAAPKAKPESKAKVSGNKGNGKGAVTEEVASGALHESVGTDDGKAKKSLVGRLRLWRR